MPVLVIVGQSPTGILEFLWQLHSMAIVVAQYAFAISIMQRQTVADAVRDLIGGLYLPCLKFHPAAVLLVNDGLMQLEESI